MALFRHSGCFSLFLSKQRGVKRCDGEMWARVASPLVLSRAFEEVGVQVVVSLPAQPFDTLSAALQIISTAVMTYTKHFDQHGRIKEIQYEIFRSLMYWITIQYDNMGRVTKREIKIGPFANTTKYGYEYDVDGQLQSVTLNEKMMWRYSYDLNGNLHLLNPLNSGRLTPLRYDLRDRITRIGDVQYRLDEDGFLRQRGAEIFEYNSKGQCV